MSTMDSEVSSPATSERVRRGTRRSVTTATSNDVPPMSQVTTFFRPAASATEREAATPAAGPDAASRMGACRASVVVIAPPDEWTRSTGTTSPSSSSVLGQLLDTRHRRHGVGVEDRVGGPLEFPDGGLAIGTGDHREGGEGVADGRHRLNFVIGIPEGPEKRHSERRHLMFLDEQAGGVDRGLRVEGDEHVTVPVDPLGHAHNAFPRDYRLGVDGPDPVRDTTPLGQGERVLESGGGDEADADTGTRREDIGHRGRAQTEAGDPGQELGQRRPRPLGDQDEASSTDRPRSAGHRR